MRQELRSYSQNCLRSLQPWVRQKAAASSVPHQKARPSAAESAYFTGAPAVPAAPAPPPATGPRARLGPAPHVLGAELVASDRVVALRHGRDGERTARRHREEHGVLTQVDEGFAMHQLSPITDATAQRAHHQI